MPLNITYATQVELRTVGPAKVARAIEARLGFKIMPIRSKKTAYLAWQQRQNYRGLQQLRGSGGTPNKVDKVGWNRKMMEPGYYGEYTVIEEDELNKRAGSVVGDATVDVSDLMMSDQDMLIQRELDLMEYIIFKVLVAGTFTIVSPNGNVYSETYGVQLHTGSDWSNPSTATPMADFRTVRATKGIGKGLNFGARAMAIMNGLTANYLFGNANQYDLAGMRVNGGNTANFDPAVLASIFLAQDLPTIMIYDEGYYDDGNTWNYYVPTDKVAIVGKRNSGEDVGQYTTTVNQYSPNGVGSYDFIKDSFKGINCAREVPGQIQNHRGHNGGAEVWFPEAFVIMSV